MKITFIGGGNMAGALIGGLRASGIAASEIAVVEPLAQARERLVSTHGVAVAEDAATLAPGSDAIVLAVKPQQLPAVARALAPHVGQAMVLSIAAGIRLADIRRWLGDRADLALVRSMPNTPALIGMGVSGVYAGADVGDAARALAERILSAAGKVCWVEREQLLDPVTAVSGSGPAYVFYFLEALQAAGAALGLAPETARELALETVRGAAELAARSSEDFATLRTRVTSPGGTTERALASLEADGVTAAIARALQAADARAAELADQLGRTP
jgi:pyrroline-5-carboxylate reductase